VKKVAIHHLFVTFGISYWLVVGFDSVAFCTVNLCIRFIVAFWGYPTKYWRYGFIQLETQAVKQLVA
jgi:hypothetical protein